MVTVRVYSKLKTSWKSVGFTNKVGKNSRYFVGVFNKTIIPLALVGYELSTVSYPTCTRGIWIANLLVAPTLCFKARLSAKPFSQERRLTSFSKWEFWNSEMAFCSLDSPSESALTRLEDFERNKQETSSDKKKRTHLEASADESIAFFRQSITWKILEDIESYITVSEVDLMWVPPMLTYNQKCYDHYIGWHWWI